MCSHTDVVGGGLENVHVQEDRVRSVCVIVHIQLYANSRFSVGKRNCGRGRMLS